MQFFTLSNFLVSLLLLVVLSLLLLPSPLVYTLSLVIFVVGSVSYASYYGLINGLIRLLILLVYVGAIIIIVSYICAVSPNLKYSFSFSSLFFSLFILFSYFILLLFPSVSYTEYSHIAPSPSLLFTDMGFWFVIFLALCMVFVLIISTYITPSSSSFRSSL